MADASPAERLAAAYRRWEESRGADPEPLLALMAEDVRLRTAMPAGMPMAEERVGVAFAREYLTSLALNLEMLGFPTEQVVDGGDTVVWIGSCAWRNRRTQGETSTPKVDVWQFEDGKAVSVLEMFDTLGFARLNRLL